MFSEEVFYHVVDIFFVGRCFAYQLHEISQILNNMYLEIGTTNCFCAVWQKPDLPDWKVFFGAGIFFPCEKCTEMFQTKGSCSLRWRSRQSECLSPLRSWVRFSLRTHVKRVCWRSAESRGVFPGALVSSTGQVAGLSELFWVDVCFDKVGGCREEAI